MKKYLAAFIMIGMMPAAPLFAQDDDLKKLFEGIDRMDQTSSPTPAPAAKGNTSPEQQPTIITATDKTTFDGATKVAVLYGNVKVKSPQFTLSADKMTVHFKKDAGVAPKDPKNQPAASPSSAARRHASPTPKPAPADPPAEQGGDIDQVVAEGNVIIETDRPGDNGGPPTHYSGKADKVVYTPATGEAVLSGWPQLQQGDNTMAATEATTVIFLYRDGSMDSKDGAVKIVVNPPPPDKKTPAPENTPEVK